MDNNIICIFVPNGVKPTFSEKEYPYRWEEEDGTFYSVMPREVYNDYLELEEENKKLKKYYDRDKEELMESCYSLAKENDELKERIDELEGNYERAKERVIELKSELEMYKKFGNSENV